MYIRDSAGKFVLKALFCVAVSAEKLRFDISEEQVNVSLINLIFF